MTALFQKPKVEAAPRPPTFDDARANLDVRKSLAGRKGRAANIIAGASEGGATASGPASKVLLGQ